jgi:gliding motility-associated-like protein
MRNFKIVIVVLLTFHFSLFTFHCKAQQQAWNWYFGDSAALNFSSGNPAVIAGSAMAAGEGCASISDASGNLLFYTNGISVWNRNNLQMPNGFGLNGNQSTTQSALIVQKPESNTIYYIFTADAFGGPNGICYSIVDMTLDAGLGDITVKNFQLLTPASEKLTAVRHCDGTDAWIIVHDATDTSYYAYLLTNAGVSVPVISTVGIPYLNFDVFGYLKASPNGNKLAVAISGVDTAQVFDFDNSTGIISNPISLPVPTSTALYGISFSPDNLKLYCIGVAICNLYQYDLSSNNQATIIASQYLVGTYANNYGGALQLGPDNKLYVDHNAFNSIGVINFPNILGVGCNFVSNAVNLGSGICEAGLPNMIDAYTYTTNPTYFTKDTTTCSNPFSLNPTVSGVSYLWSTGSTTQSIAVTSNGTYWVQVFDSTACIQGLNYIDTFNVTFAPVPVVNLPSDSSICNGDFLTLNAENTGNLYNWSTGATTQTITVSTTGIYSVSVTNNSGCVGTASEMVTVIQLPIVTSAFYADTIIGCSPLTIQFHNTSTNGSAYLWNFGDGSTDTAMNPTHTFLDSGSYSITLIATDTTPCGIVADTFSINDYISVNVFHPVAAFTSNYTVPIYTGDTIYFQDESYDPTLAGITLWQWWFGDGTGSNFENPNHQWDLPGMYQVTLIITNSKGCKDSAVFDYIDVIEGIINIPNVFTPNNDGYNDYFEIQTSGIENYSLQIFNRWGMIIFESNSNGISWDGYNQAGVQCPDGTYYYVLRATAYSGKDFNRAGFVMLLR